MIASGTDRGLVKDVTISAANERAMQRAGTHGDRAAQAKVTREPLAVQPITVHELDLTPLDTVAEAEKAISALVCADTLMRVRLTGSLHFLLDAQSLEGRFQNAFYHLEVRDESDAISEELLRTWAAERTIRGVFVKRMWDELKGAGTEAERQNVTRALRYGVRALRGQA